MALVATKDIYLNQSFASKEEAIIFAGKCLVESGYVSEEYVPAMLQREELTTTYIGNGVAIPHGTDEAKETIKDSGISFIQVPKGIDFGEGNVATILVGIAGKDNEHLDIISKLAILFSDEDNVEQISKAATIDEIMTIIEGAEL
ncbi:PTS sugar transporter subunit IIA [Bacillus sp. 1P06AnD]|uniref:PTS sugar transporter subunit IIA n=1 Tax=Bacillus sp. 1P06AnD TaxID=3132208 RepID=UPI0039A174DA